ncbi:MULTISPECIES: nickel pincer cofactor biosynthesis protein LarC [unclassified Enterococcus]|uniref:nickel pincer cofactor biosynthesis protein LarC n=1 Tax=unclassified Enterococcus TaxID=2608891 RepID=UPI000A3491D3|nr:MULTISPECIES: nickel pincer cofactor biosynthesis protein LarC [unclassified Enterococcus]OTO65659.1 hypothetical protein A5865_003723 [Enterococcus sp. 12E11_DIV0728]OUZ13526.1 hypothetical protein A5868_003729 [Enterococcus sp. 12F9_DIV0723]
MKNLYLEPFSGLSGDMLNGLLIDLGGDVAALEQELAKLSVGNYHLHVQRIAKNSIYGTDFDVHLAHGIKDNGVPHDFDAHASHVHPAHEQAHEHSHAHTHSHSEARNLRDILALIDQSTLSQQVKQHSRQVFNDIAKAEAAVHNKPIEEIHFHEVGAIDSIVDVVSFFILWEQLQIAHVYSSPITEGSGTITVAHGVMPVPVPAVMQLRKGTNLIIHQDTDVWTELVTPTGIAIFKEIHPSFVLNGVQQIEKVGYGFGKRETGKFNALRGSLMAVEPSKRENHQTQDQILKIEANIDDQTPEQLGFVMALLLDQGVLDVFYTPIQMKKNRCGILLTVLCTPEQKEFFTKLLFKQTATIGVRYTQMARTVMARQFVTKQTPYGEIQVKQNRYEDIEKNTLEFQDCQRIAKENNLSIYEVYKKLEKYS